jgi:hypothetical protein
MYGNLGIAEVQRIKQLESENRKLKQLAGDQELAIQVINENIKKKWVLTSHPQEIVDMLIGKHLSERRACPPGHATVSPSGGSRQRDLRGEIWTFYA